MNRKKRRKSLLGRIRRSFRRDERLSVRRRSRWGRRALWTLALPWLIAQKLVKQMWYTTATFFKGVGEIWRKKTWKLVAQGLPAFFAWLAVVGVAVAVKTNNPDLEDDYGDEARVSFGEEDYQAARIYFERLSEINPDRTNRFNLALALMKLKETDRARAVLRELAPPTGPPGYVAAHLWLAQEILISPSAYEDVALISLAQQHLTQALEAAPRSATPNLRMAQFLVASGRPADGVPYLTRASEIDRKIYYELGMLLSSLGRSTQAKEAMRLASTHYSKRLREAPHDKDARRRLASIRMNLDDFNGAIQLLQEGAVLHPKDDFHLAIAHACVTQFDRLQNAKSTHPSLQLELLRIALANNPDSTDALGRLAAVGETTAESKKATTELLETLVASGYANAFGHFALGCKAWEAEEQESALFHFERAFKLDENLGPVGNNLAWILTTKDEPEPERALNLIESVLKRWPDNPAYRETRGQIFAQLERWNDALDDLEYALPRLKSNAETHQALASTYAGLGQDKLAEKHRTLAKLLSEDN